MKDNNMNYAIILAGGTGTRLKNKTPKQFIKIKDKPIIIYSLETFDKHNNIHGIIVVCEKNNIDYLNSLVKEYKLDKVKWIIQGGDTFQLSVANGVNYLKDKINDNDNVLIHWSAAPLVTNDIIQDSINICNIYGNAISTTNFYHLAGIKDNNIKSTKWLDRDKIACLSTPHTFNYKYIYNLYNNAIEKGIINLVEPHTTSLMYHIGDPIYFSKGSNLNIKITTKEDLILMEALLNIL